ncbi:MAG: GNAT family N-acetyltransferase [Pseudomonadota bacterium]
MAKDYTIHPMEATDLVLFEAHFARHRSESGRGGDYHFMPFAPDDADGPNGMDPSTLARSLDEPGWQRWWVAKSGGNIVGHVDLKGGGIKAQLHRCELGIGIERAYRGRGLGRVLMNSAITFCQLSPSIEWLDLRVFAHNKNARHLYRSMGFEEYGLAPDWVRIGPTKIDDVLMTLSVT